MSNHTHFIWQEKTKFFYTSYNGALLPSISDYKLYSQAEVEHFTANLHVLVYMFSSYLLPRTKDHSYNQYYALIKTLKTIFLQAYSQKTKLKVFKKKLTYGHMVK